ALGQYTGLACALDRHFDAASPALQRELPPQMAAELAAIPLNEVSPEPRLVAVAFMDPPDAEVLARVGERLRAEVVPVICPELRLKYQLERVYGLPRQNRFVRVRKPSEPPPVPPEPGRERRRYIKTLSDVEPEADSETLGRIAIVKRKSVPAIVA